MSSLEQRRESPRRPAPGINWIFIGGIVVSVACWTGVGWLLWRVTH